MRFAGVIRQPNGLFANINGRFVRVGDTLNKAKVIHVSRSSVEMELDGKRFFVGFGVAHRAAPAPAEADANEPGDPPDGDPPGQDGASR